MLLSFHPFALLVPVAAQVPVPPGETYQATLVTLLVRVGAVAAMASMMIRFNAFKAVLFRESRSLSEQLQLGAFLGLAYGLGVAVRVSLNYKAPDLGLEGSLLAGLLGGPVVGVVAGGIMAIPALLNGQWVTPAALILVGAVGAGARRFSPESDDIWHFSPFVDMNIYRWYQRRFLKPRGDWQMMVFLMIVVLEMAYIWLGRLVHGQANLLLRYIDDRAIAAQGRVLFYLDSPSDGVKFAIIVAGIACVAIPIKVWNNTRNELIVEEQGRLLVEARLAALSTQISPHFLFNTLNSISSLIRVEPELARVMIQKLASILRRLLRRHDAFAWLSEELDLIDDYLDIEVVRFGADKLKIVKEIDEQALTMQIPSMILQPLIENSIKHGISARVSGGVIAIRARRADGRLHLEVEDNGAGMKPWALAQSGQRGGIGLSNVRERLKMLYGSECLFEIHSSPGQGTRIEIDVPEIPEVEVGRSRAAGG